MKKLIYLGVSIVILFSLNSCFKCNGKRFAEKMVEKSIERETGKKVDVDYGGSGRVRLPATFPRELVPPGGKATGKFTVNTDEGVAITLTFETNRSIDRVVSHYENLANWQSKYNMETSDGVSIGLFSGKKSAIISITKEDSKTVVGIVYGTER